LTESEPDVFRKLQEHLDKMPIGYPATESGVEIRILKHLFTTDEAELATKLTYMPLPIEKIYRKVKKSGITIEELQEKLDKMGRNGSINYGSERGSEKRFYFNAFFVVGMYEYQLNQLTKEFCEDCMQYMEEAFFKEFNLTKLPQLRTIPISQTLDVNNLIAPYEDIKQLINVRTGPIAVGTCICRQEKDLMGEPCKHSDIRETCFFFGPAAIMYVEKDQGRMISKEEALALLKKAEDAGFVLQPTNSKRPMGLCCCCGCCCGVLTHQKKLNVRPAELFHSNYYSEIDPDMCSGCETCLDRCQMEAIEIVDDVATVLLDRCIGCALCVPSCPSEAITLIKKDIEFDPPANTMEFYQKLMDKKAALARESKAS